MKRFGRCRLTTLIFITLEHLEKQSSYQSLKVQCVNDSVYIGLSEVVKSAPWTLYI